jgi:hypothetical protein
MRIHRFPLPLTRHLLPALILVAACGKMPHRDASDDSAAPGSAAASTAPLSSPDAPALGTGDTAAPVVDADTGTVVALGPIVVAVCVITDAAADSSEALGTIRSDFENYLGDIEDSLAQRGVGFAVRNERPVHVTVGGRLVTWPVSADSGRVGYLLVAPGKPPRSVWGVHTALGAEADAYFGRAADPGRTP